MTGLRSFFPDRWIARRVEDRHDLDVFCFDPVINAVGEARYACFPESVFHFRKEQRILSDAVHQIDDTRVESFPETRLAFLIPIDRTVKFMTSEAMEIDREVQLANLA